MLTNADTTESLDMISVSVVSEPNRQQIEQSSLVGKKY